MSLLQKITMIGTLPHDDEDTIVQKQFLVYEGILMSFGGLVWGILAVIFGYSLQSIIPFGYIVLTVFNLTYFYYTKNFGLVKAVQTGISLLLPFMFQWGLGGFIDSGIVMLWALLALAASLTYQDFKITAIWLMAYIVLTIISGVYDDNFIAWIKPTVEKKHAILFMVINIVMISSMVFGLVSYIVNRKNHALRSLKAAQFQLSDRITILGQLVAGVAHEVNTPLGAIKSSAEEVSLSYDSLLKKMPYLIRSISEEHFQNMVYLQNKAKVKMDVLSSREERIKRLKLAEELEEYGLENPRYNAGLLMQAGLGEIGPEMLSILRSAHAESTIENICSMVMQKRNTENILLAVEKASRVVKAFKTYLHGGGNTEKLTLINLKESLDTVLTIYQNKLKQGVDVIRKYEEVSQIPAYSDQLNQVWTNLIHNAIQAMKYKGTLTISIHDLGDSLEISFADTGVGIDTEMQEKIFTPFFTTKPLGEGTGLGLDIVRQIISKHNGSIRVKSELGSGAEFIVKLPKENSKLDQA